MVNKNEYTEYTFTPKEVLQALGFNGNERLEAPFGGDRFTVIVKGKTTKGGP